MRKDSQVTVVHTERSLALGRLELFASSPKDPRTRRPIDWIRAVVSLATLVTFGVLADIGDDLDSEIANTLADFPSFLQTLWRIGFFLGLAWAVILFAFALFGKRRLLAIEVLGASALAIVVCAVVAAIVTDESRVFESLIDADGPPAFPPAAIAVTMAVISTMTPYITLPFRRFGRALVVLQMAGSIFLGATVGSGAIAALAVGYLAGSAMHLAFGSPGGFPTVGRVTLALRQLGIELDNLTRLGMRRDGVALLEGNDRNGPVLVRVYGRDAWDGDLFSSAWLHLWYRDSGRSTRLRGPGSVEHEGFLTFIAAREGVSVPEVLTAGKAENGDALIVIRMNGVPLVLDDQPFDKEYIQSLWAELDALHRAGMSHHRIDLDRVVRTPEGRAGFADLSSASVQADASDLLKDRAQLFGLTILKAGEATAVAEAREALGDVDLTEVLPYVQEAALPPLVRSALGKQDVELDDVRKRLTEALGADKTDLVKLRRVTWGSLINVGLLTFGMYAVIGMLGGIDYEEFFGALQDANWWWLVFALFIGQLPRVAAAFSTMGSTTQTLPLGPTVGLQFATCYINLTVPSSAGRVALTTRYFQRFGIAPATAISAGFIDTLSQTAIQISLFLLIFFASDVDLDLSVDTDQLSGLATIALIAVGVIIALIIVVAAVPSLRRRAIEQLRKMKQAFEVFRMPRKVMELIGGNLGSELLFALTLAMVTRAFGYELPFSTFILINVVVSLFSSVIPVPGGIGVTEAGLTLGLTRAGVDSDTAFAIALSHRFITFYLPPFWGFASYKWLIKHRFL
jgi:glycosyltransferase 2 family protein